MDMREKIARSLAHCDWMHPDAVSNDEDEFPIWTTYLDVADAVLDVLMEPTEGMIDAMAEDMWNGIYAVPADKSVLIEISRTAIPAMIKAAKEGK